MRDFSKTSIIELAAIVAEHLERHGIDVVLVGGLAVEIYTDNLYLTKDIDMVNTNYQTPKKMNPALAELGFHKEGRIYVNDTTDITLEFPPGPLAVGNTLISVDQITRVGEGQIPILGIKDVIKDRLAAYIHWGDQQSLIQALAMMLKHDIEPNTFQEFCTQEGASASYTLLKALYTEAESQQVTTMEHLETLLTKTLLDSL
ncbi:nucleotidyltransferase [Saccharospirillum salsuginis]|uniref:Uncharacterized protein n=1 Tax=Saccharospirillum salsuginis TaxID=418750 RepID=A0A918N679_9GAMM|nr:nucleotidyltransferase [Saccharospirillum salsuginis]GGX41732.1 hypothetical protein GCM10007392_05800 [Saccharospirillum salsuginis]